MTCNYLKHWQIQPNDTLQSYYNIANHTYFVGGQSKKVTLKKKTQLLQKNLNLNNTLSARSYF